MASAWDFPASLNVGGVDYEIRTDYRAVLDLFTALNDPECFGDSEEETKIIHANFILQIMFPKCDEIPPEHIQEALDKVSEFIDMGISDDRKKPKMMDWEQDAPILVPSINKVLNREIRAEKYIHWWTFLGAYMEIGEGLFCNILSIRSKLAKKEKLEKWEQKFYQENKSLIDLNRKDQRSDEEREALRDYFGYKK